MDELRKKALLFAEMAERALIPPMGVGYRPEELERKALMYSNLALAFATMEAHDLGKARREA